MRHGITLGRRSLCSKCAQAVQCIRAAGGAPDGAIPAQGGDGDGGVGANIGRPVRRDVVVAVVVAC